MIEKTYFPATGMPDADWWSALWPDPERTLKELGIGSGSSVVDLCCGDGHFTVPLCNLVGPAGAVYGLDMAPDLLVQAKNRMAEDGPDYAEDICTWIEADACHIDELLARDAPAGVDVVWMANTFHGVPEHQALMRAVGRVLNPGGRFIVINWHARPRQETTVLDQPRGPKTDMRMAPEAVSAVAVAAGFEPGQVVELPPYHYGLIMRVAKVPSEG